MGFVNIYKKSKYLIQDKCREKRKEKSPCMFKIYGTNELTINTWFFNHNFFKSFSITCE